MEAKRNSFNANELNFAKQIRGKKPAALNYKVPDNLTQTQCVSNVAEIFDITGKVTLTTAALKLDL